MNNKKITKLIEVTNINKGIRKTLLDEVVVEYSLSIFVNDILLATLFCSNCNLKELAIGHLFTNRIITSINDISGVVLEEKEDRADINIYIDENLYNLNVSKDSKKIITTSSGRQYSYFEDVIKHIDNLIKSNNTTFLTEEILKEVEGFCCQSEGFNKTGGLHSAKLCSSNGIAIHMEDIGRHNAFDKVVGAGLTDKIDFSSSYIITSGRVPSDMIIKAITSGIPLLVSRSAPTNVSVQIAEEMGLTLIGFARGERLNIYTICERII